MNVFRENLTGIILAGGRSSRMGQDKSSLTWEGVSFLEKARQTLIAAGCARVAVSGGEGPDAIADTLQNAGPARAIHDVISALSLNEGGYLFLPVDLPLLQPGDLRRLMQSSRPHAYRDHPLPCFIPAPASLPETPSGQSVFRLLEELDVEWTEADADLAERLFNVNTPDDLSRLRGKA